MLGERDVGEEIGGVPDGRRVVAGLAEEDADVVGGVEVELALEEGAESLAEYEVGHGVSGVGSRGWRCAVEPERTSPGGGLLGSRR